MNAKCITEQVKYIYIDDWVRNSSGNGVLAICTDDHSGVDKF